MRLLTLTLASAVACAGVAAAQDGLIIDRDRPDRNAPGAALQPRTETSRRAATNAPHINVAPFVLRHVRVEGARVLRSALNRAIGPLIGRTLDGDGLQEIADAVSRALAQSDVALYAVEIPEQDFSSGDVRIRVRAGYINAVSIGGETSGNIELLRHYAATLAAERPLSRATMERELSLISDIPGAETRVGMGAADASGGVTLGLQVDRTPWDYELAVNNRGSDALGHLQVFGTAIRNDVFRLGDQTRLTLGADSEFDRFRFVGVSHRQPIGFDGMSITARISSLRTEPDNGAEGRADSAGVLVSYPIIRSYRRNLTLSAGVDGVNSDNAVLGDLVASERTRVVRAAAAFADADVRSSLVLTAALSRGIDGAGADALDPATDLDFTKLNAQISYNRALGRRFVARLAASAQSSDDALPASERFSIGGAFGRAFPSASASGDQGYGATAELAWRTPWTWLAETYAFADGGRVWTTDRPLAPGFSRDLASAGAGVRLRLSRETELDLEAAKPIDEPIPGAETQGWRLRFGVSTRL